MDFLSIITPAIYWFLAAIWTYILFFLVRKYFLIKKNALILILIIVLSIDAFRTIVESVYFSFLSTSLSGIISTEIHNFLMRPEIYIIPKLLNVTAALAIVFLLIRKWFPAEEKEREALNNAVTQAHKELKQSEMYLKLSQSISKIGHYVLDAKTGFWTSSEMLDKIFGIDDSFIKNIEGWLKIVHPDQREEMQTYFNTHILHEKKSFNKEYRIKRVYNGESVWVHGLGTLEVDEQGNITKMIGTIQDISERKQLEDRLFQTEKLQAIGQLAGGIAHDFNNQLTGISVYADLLKDELSSNPELARYADGIILATQRASGITSQLLAFARKGKYLSMRIDLHKIIHEVINLIRHVIDKNIVIKQHLKAQKAFIIGDPAQIQNAIMNLAINARDAMPKGGSLIFRTDVVHLDEEYCKTLPYEINPGSYIRLSVSDTGIGIGKEIIGNIFDPFFTTKEPGKGTGMGLAAVFGTVKNHGGIINVYSEPGQGTRMQMSFPLASESVKNGITIHADNKIEKGSAHILLVDDEEFILDSASQMLQSLGYRVSMCRNGDEAIAYYRENWGTVDLVLLDMIMPVMDGKRCFRMMKKINPEIKALLCSGYSMNTKAQTLIDEGVMDFIQKPFSMIDISKKIKEILKINAKT